MKQFSYYVKTHEGQSKKGVVEAVDESQAALVLKERGFILITLKPKTESLVQMVKRKLFSRVTLNDTVNLTRQLATMINAGLVITDGLTILKSQTENPNMVAIINSIQEDIEGGGSFSDSLRKYPQIFDTVYVSLVKSGEAAGILDKVLLRLADNLEKKREFSSKIKGAMIYPVIIVSGMGLVGAVMMIFVVPKMLDLYSEFQATLPTPTLILMAVSNFMRQFWYAALVIIAVGIWLLRRFYETEFGKVRVDTVFNSFPIIGKLRRAVMLAEFSRTLGLLVGGGILVVDALRVAEGSVGSIIYKLAIREAAKEVEKGSGLAVALARAEIFPPLLPQMVSVGEETGKLDEVLLKIASYFQEEGETAVRNLTTAIEPLIMVLLGLGVGFLIIAIIMPIYNLTSQF